MKTCASCDTPVTDATGYFSDQGLVCESCNAANEARDAAAFAEGSDVDLRVQGPGQATLQRGNATLTVQGPLGAVLGLIQWIVGLVRGQPA